MRDFKKNGLMLSPEKREQLKAMRKSTRTSHSLIDREYTASGLRMSNTTAQPCVLVQLCSSAEMSDNAITFQKNLNEDTTAFYFSREELDGLPQDFLDGLEKVDGQVQRPPRQRSIPELFDQRAAFFDTAGGDKEGGATKYKVSLRYPELLPVMRYANNAETRRKLDTANAARSMLENTPLLEETLALRHGTNPSVSYLNLHSSPRN